jgi:uncharacterized membrane protein YjgN (DUF898 family)
MASEQEIKLRVSFGGKGGEFFVLLIKNFFLTLITLGVYNFWARVNVQRYFYSHTSIAGGRIGWHATGKERFVGFLKAALILAVIIGLNTLLIKISPFLGIILPVAVLLLLPAIIVAMYRFRLSRTSYNQVRFRFSGRAGNLAAITLKGGLLTLVTFGVYAAWFSAHLRTYLYRHTIIGGSSFDYDGDGGDIFVVYLKGVLLTMITFGIYNSWFTAEVANYHMNHTLFQGQRLKGDVDGADIFVLNFLGPLATLVTLGLWVPWWMVKLKKVMLEGVSLAATPDLDLMHAELDTNASALADGLADAASLLDNIADFLT